MLLMCVAGTALLFAGPADEIPVQRPGERSEGAERQPSEGAEPTPAGEAPADEAPASEDPASAPPDPDPASAGPIVPLGGAPAGLSPATDPETADSGGAIISWRDAGPAPRGADGRDELSAAPVYRGTGLFLTGGLAFGSAILKQALSPIFCDGTTSLNCGSVGWVDRSLMAGAIGLIGGGGWQRGAWAAGEGGKIVSAARVRTRRIVGWTLAGVGFAGAAVDLGFAAACWQSGEGPYAVSAGSPFVVSCRSTVTGLVLDASAILAGTGMGLGLWANAYAATVKDQATAARFTNVVPMVGAGRWGLGLGGRF